MTEKRYKNRNRPIMKCYREFKWENIDPEAKRFTRRYKKEPNKIIVGPDIYLEAREVIGKSKYDCFCNDGLKRGGDAWYFVYEEPYVEDTEDIEYEEVINTEGIL